MFVSIFAQLKYGKGINFMDLQLHMKSVPISTKVVNLKHTNGEVNLVQHYVIKFVSDLRQISGCLQVLQFPPPINVWYDIVQN